MTDGVYIVDDQYNIEFINDALKKEFGEILGQKCFAYFHARKDPCPWCKNAEVFKNKIVRWQWHSSKKQRDYDLIDSPLLNLDGSISKLEIFRDITELKQAEKELTRHRHSLEKLVEERTLELEEKIAELEHMNDVFVGREFRVKELRDRVNELELKVEN